MQRPRLIYYNDAHHFHAKRIEPPASLHMLQWPVDEVAGTGVGALVLGLGYGDVYFHQTRVGRVVGQHKERWENYIDWRILRMVEEAQRLGTDQVRQVIGRGRALGVPVYPSLKLQDTAEPGGERCGALKGERGAQVCIGEEGRYRWGYDFAHEVVRQDKLALLKELLDEYGPEGLELDFMFDLRFFRRGEVQQGRPLMTDFVRRVRELTRQAERPVPLLARVALEEERNREAGLEVRAWLAEGLLDGVVGQDERALFDTQPRPAWLPEAAQAAGAAAYYRPPRRVYHEATGFPHIEMYRALQHTLAGQGWAGLYLGYLPWPLADEEYRILREMAFPEVTARREKRYFLQPREGGAGEPSSTPERVLPALLEEGQALALSIWVADDVEAARADGEMRRPVLALRFAFFCIEDEISFRFNGKELDRGRAEIGDERALSMAASAASLQRVQAPTGFSAHWFRFALEVDQLRRGENILEVICGRFAPKAAFARSLNGVEVRTRYRDMERPEGLEGERVFPTA